MLLADCGFVALASSLRELVSEVLWQSVGKRVRLAQSDSRANSGSRGDRWQNVNV